MLSELWSHKQTFCTHSLISGSITGEQMAEKIWRRAVSPGGQDVIAGPEPWALSPGAGQALISLLQEHQPTASSRIPSEGNSEHEDSQEDPKSGITYRSELTKSGTNNSINSSQALTHCPNTTKLLLCKVFSSKVYQSGFLCNNHPPNLRGAQQ